MKIASIDFEFIADSNKYVDLVCCSIRRGKGTYSYWLLDDEDQKDQLSNHLIDLDHAGYTFLAHGVGAEASAFLALGLKPAAFKWICTFAEYRCLSNHNHAIQYGKHYIDGKVKTIYPPRNKWDKRDAEGPSGKIKHSYAEACYKFLGVKIDTDHKEHMRDIIISGDKQRIQNCRVNIQKYCDSDVKHLEGIFENIRGLYNTYTDQNISCKQYIEDAHYRGETMARTAIMESMGYPIDYEATYNFATQIPKILNECCRDIVEQFPDRGFFEFNAKTGKYTKKEQPIRDWIDELSFDWMQTETEKHSLSLDAFAEHFSFRHSYPRGNIGAQLLRFLKLKQSLNGFTKTPKKKSFWDSVGNDKRVRSYLNPYGSQTARYQPGSTGFLFLKSAWMRRLCVPPKGRMIVGIDYKSEEFLISGLESKDLAMINTYLSGDVYLGFGKDAGLVPQHATKATHGKERDIFKPVVLGISYDMTKIGLAKKLSQDTGEEVEQWQAQEYIDSFNEAYSTFAQSKEDFLEEFAERGYYRLSDGWIMFADNESERSIKNFKIQGKGSCILRKAIALCQDEGLDVVVPLHDALYIECDLNDWQAVEIFARCMRDAFIFYYIGTDMEEYARGIMLDLETWSPEIEEGERMVVVEDGLDTRQYKMKCEHVHIDPRAGDEYKTFQKYFDKPDEELI